MPSVCAVEELVIAFSTDVHAMVAVGMWPYLLEHLKKVTCLNLGRSPVASVLYHLYFDARDALEVQLPLLKVIVVPSSSEFRELVAMIADLRGQLVF